LSAQIIDYSITGTFGSSAPSTLVSAPNATFDIQFSLLTQQPPNSFDARFTDESFALNGQTTFSGQSGIASFGMGIGTPSPTLTVSAGNNDLFTFDSLQELFTGHVSSPTLIPASLDFLLWSLNIPNASILANPHLTATVAVPELSSMRMFLIGLSSCAGFAILRNKRRMIAKNNIWIDGNLVAGD